MLKIEIDKCTGCEMCKEVCPYGAIYFKVINGFKLPQVDIKKCVNCNLCNKLCPAQNEILGLNDFPESYAGYTKNIEQRKKCTSGGICYELSKSFIERGGYVAGVAWTNSYKDAEYILINSMENLAKITQSKYFQPKMNNIFSKVQRILEEEKEVLFIGTSCSNAALKSYLKKNYEKLLCCDFVCRGYTSQVYHEKRITELEKEKHSRIAGVYYKDKTQGWEQFGTKFNFENGESFFVNRYNDPYENMLFMNDYLTRESCFECKYRSFQRITDITVGDFWGINNIRDEDKRLGVSLILVHSEKGKNELAKIKDNLELQERSIWEMAKGNHCLNQQLVCNKGREEFYKDLEKFDINYIHKKYGDLKKYKTKVRIKKIKNLLKIILKLNIISFIKYNYFYKNIKRNKSKFIFPYKGTKLNISRSSKIIINGNLYLNDGKHKGSSEETYFTVNSNAKFIVNNTTRIFANSTIEILPNSIVEIDQMNSNYNLTMVCANEIRIGRGVEIGRNVTLYDSNFHKTGLTKNIKGRPLIIKDHVWLCTGVCVAKGLTIYEGAICGINSTVTKNIKERTMVLGNPAKTMMENVSW